MAKVKFEQISFGFLGAPSQEPAPQPVKAPPAKKPFIPPLVVALDRNEAKTNFVYLLRVLTNSAARSLDSAAAQAHFINALTAEAKIKKGLADAEIVTRSAILQNSVK